MPRKAHVFLATQLLAMPDPLRGGLATAVVKPLFAELTGHDRRRWDEDCGTAAAGRLAVAMPGPVITAYEHAMTDGEGRSTWRTDRYSPCPRAEAGRYLAVLASIGDRLSAIEQAVADGVSYSGEQPAGDSLPGADLGDIAVSGHPIGGAADHGDSNEDATTWHSCSPCRRRSPIPRPVPGPHPS